jgi:hypothetical protein
MTEKRGDVDAISDRTLLVLYLACVHHPYLFPLLRQVCTTLHDDKELEIEFLKYSKTYKRSRDGMKYLFGRLEVYVDSMSTETLMDYIIELISSSWKNDSDTETSEMKSRISKLLLNKMRENEKHKYEFEGRVKCHYHSLKSCTHGDCSYAARRSSYNGVRMTI